MNSSNHRIFGCKKYVDPLNKKVWKEVKTKQPAQTLLVIQALQHQQQYSFDLLIYFYIEIPNYELNTNKKYSSVHS